MNALQEELRKNGLISQAQADEAAKENELLRQGEAMGFVAFRRGDHVRFKPTEDLVIKDHIAEGLEVVACDFVYGPAIESVKHFQFVYLARRDGEKLFGWNKESRKWDNPRVYVDLNNGSPVSGYYLEHE